MYLDKKAIKNKPRIERINLINSLTGIKPGNLVGTKSIKTGSNLAVFSSIIHLGSFPPLLGFILRPSDEVRRNTFENILENGYYTINHIPVHKTENAHYTSAKFEANINEFDYCDFEEEYFNNFYAPYVKESPIKIGMKYIESIPIHLNNTTLVIGEIEEIHIPDEHINYAGQIDLESSKSAGISGLNTYYELKKINSYPYARVKEVPEFKKQK